MFPLLCHPPRQVVRAYDPQQFGILWLPPAYYQNAKLAPKQFRKCSCGSFFTNWLWPSGLVSPNSSCTLFHTRGTVCFPNIIVGGAAFGYHQYRTPGDDDTFSGLAPSFCGLRDIVRAGFGLGYRSSAAAQHILIVEKTGKRRILNTDALRARLTDCFPGVVVSVSDMNRPPREQLRAVDNATVIIAPSGSVAYTALFAGSHTVMIQPDRHVPSQNRSLGVDQYVFMNTGVRFMAYPIKADEVLRVPRARPCAPGPVYSCPWPVCSCPGPVTSCPGPMYACPGPMRLCPGPVYSCPGPVHSCTRPPPHLLIPVGPSCTGGSSGHGSRRRADTFSPNPCL